MKRICHLFIGLIVLSFWFNVTSVQGQTRPTVSISAPSTPQKDPFDVTITFNIFVNNFVQGDVSVSGAASITNWTVETTGRVYIARFTPRANTESSVTIQVPRGVAEAGGTTNRASRVVTVDTDTVAPFVIMKRSEGWVVTGRFSVVADFGERVYGFTRDGVTLTGSLKSQVTGFSGSNGSATYTITITPEAKDFDDDSPRNNGTVRISVARSVTEDAAGNPNTAHAAYKGRNVIVNFPVGDTERPYPTIIVPTGTQRGDFEVTVEFDESVRGFSASDVDLDWGPLGNYSPDNPPTSRVTITNWTAHTGGTRYTFTVRSSSTRDGNVFIRVEENVATDSAGNRNYKAVSKRVRVNRPSTAETTRPTAEITMLPTDTQNDSFDVTVTFNEIVVGFTQSDLRVSGGGASITNWNPQSGGRNYIATITPTRDGDVRFNVSANVAQDRAGNGNTAASQQTVTVDVPDISVSISAPSSAQRAAFDVTVRFSATVTGFVQSELRVSGAGASVTSWEPQSGGRNYEATITPTQAGDVVFNVNAGVSAEGNRAATSVMVVVWPEDVDQDGYIDNVDLLLVAMNFGETPSAARHPRADVDRDGDIDTRDFQRVVDRLWETVSFTNSAPAAVLTSQPTSHEWLQRIKELNIPDPDFQNALQLLEEQLAESGFEKHLLEPALKETVLLANYPNPFNPETWIPYQLSKDAHVTLTIYATNGQVVRTLALGNQAAGNYLYRTRAAYWDGRNAFGEQVASGVYFYTLSAGDFSATRRMLIAK